MARKNAGKHYEYNSRCPCSIKIPGASVKWSLARNQKINNFDPSEPVVRKLSRGHRYIDNAIVEVRL
jgi:hypothetical protein